jgi:3'5'-cyclic nucleotide phosphodiesterase N-terminal
LENRRLADEDDELSEVQPDAVPPEVREWLASTFTRQLATTRKKSDEKPKFRSVAHAIRAGIFVDRIYRRISSTALMQFPPEVVKVLKVKLFLSSLGYHFLCSKFFLFSTLMTGLSMYLHWLNLETVCQ